MHQQKDTMKSLHHSPVLGNKAGLSKFSMILLFQVIPFQMAHLEFLQIDHGQSCGIC